MSRRSSARASQLVVVVGESQALLPRLELHRAPGREPLGELADQGAAVCVQVVVSDGLRGLAAGHARAHLLHRELPVAVPVQLGRHRRRVPLGLGEGLRLVPGVAEGGPLRYHGQAALQVLRPPHAREEGAEVGHGRRGRELVGDAGDAGVADAEALVDHPRREHHGLPRAGREVVDGVPLVAVVHGPVEVPGGVRLLGDHGEPPPLDPRERRGDCGDAVLVHVRQRPRLRRLQPELRVLLHLGLVRRVHEVERLARLLDARLHPLGRLHVAPPPLALVPPRLHEIRVERRVLGRVLGQLLRALDLGLLRRPVALTEGHAIPLVVAVLPAELHAAEPPGQLLAVPRLHGAVPAAVRDYKWHARAPEQAEPLHAEVGEPHGLLRAPLDYAIVLVHVGLPGGVGCRRPTLARGGGRTADEVDGTQEADTARRHQRRVAPKLAWTSMA
mmetsp:Transcript_108754/g.307594  ORF Transcript_108754/g.307594 Transcript_108754/m.307594 type:complete len:445 (+) Transcript_108754:32-1366(+)